MEKIDKSLTKRRARDRLRADRDPRHRHRQLGPLLPRQAGVLRAGRAVPRRQARRRRRRGPRARARTWSAPLCVRGANVIKGYLNRPEATAEAIRDGWFDTGDVARIDEDGFVYIVDRAKDMVLRGGENIYSSEVETAIYQHDGVAEAAVFGIPDERLGEDVAAVVVPPGRRDARRGRTAGVPRRPHRQAQDPGRDLVPRRAAAPQRQRQVPQEGPEGRVHLLLTRRPPIGVLTVIGVPGGGTSPGSTLGHG